ncbi:MAG: tetratricopeptide repeat protein [Candidatus Zixiibacteriota bacterium]
MVIGIQMIAPAALDDRIEKCQKILNEDPNSQIFAALADAYRKKGDLEKAFRICQNGLRIHPSYGSAHVVMAKINLDRGLYDWAEIEAQKAVAIDGRTRSIELLLAEIYIYKGEFNAAIKLLDRLHQSEPDHPQIKKLLAIARRLPQEQAVLTGTSDTTGQQSAETAEAKSEAVQPQHPTKLNAKEVLAKSIAIPGIEGVLFMNFEGLVVESEWTLKMDPSVCAAIMGEISKEVNKSLMKSSLGKLCTVLIETGDLIFYLVQVPDGIFHFSSNASVNLGTLRMRIENLLAKYQPRG